MQRHTQAAATGFLVGEHDAALPAQIVLGGVIALERSDIHVVLAGVGGANDVAGGDKGIEQMAEIFVFAMARLP